MDKKKQEREDSRTTVTEYAETNDGDLKATVRELRDEVIEEYSRQFAREMNKLGNRHSKN